VSSFTLWPKSKGHRNLKWLLFEKGDIVLKEWVGWEWKPKLWLRGRWFLFIKKSIIDKILAIRLEGLFWAWNKVGCSFGFELWAWHLEASWILCPAEGSNYYTLLAIFSIFIWTLNKVCPLNPAASRLRRPSCEAALRVCLPTRLPNNLMFQVNATISFVCYAIFFSLMVAHSYGKWVCHQGF
jgi:hypothetical protein